MRPLRCASIATLALLAGCSAPPTPDSGPGNHWRPLFDGRSLDGWHAYHAPNPPPNWRVAEGTLMTTGPGPDLVTDGQYANYELMVDWKVGPGGNSGIIYRVGDTAEATYETGPEMQVLDDARHPDGKSPLTSAGALFGLQAAPRGVVRAAGEWNTARLLVNGNHVEHWLNGQKLLEYELGSADFAARVAASKFREWPGFGKGSTGFIALQAHGDTVSFRNIRIRTLP